LWQKVALLGSLSFVAAHTPDLTEVGAGQSLLVAGRAVRTLARPWLPGVAFGRVPQEPRLTLHLQHQVDALYQVVYLLGRRISQLLVGEQLLVVGKHFFLP
jgi:hypothetical protein